VADLAVELVDEAAPGGTRWPELLPAMFACVASASPQLMEAGLVVMGALATHMVDAFLPQVAGQEAGWVCREVAGRKRQEGAGHELSVQC
jgi:hypothetical protein